MRRFPIVASGILRTHMHLTRFTGISNVMFFLFLPVWISGENLWMGRHNRCQPWVPSKTSWLKENKSSAISDCTEYNLSVGWSYGTGFLCRNCFFPPRVLVCRKVDVLLGSDFQIKDQSG
jgi:hypothetical protein